VVREPLVCVIVLNWNGKELLRECLESLQQTAYGAMTVVVVDNGSSDGSADMVRGEFPQVELIENPTNIGFCRGNNAGFRYALDRGAAYCVLLNNDVTVRATWLGELVAAAEEDGRVGALSPKMLMADSETTLNSAGLCCSIIGCVWDRGFGEPDGPEWDTPAEVVGVSGGAFFVRSSALREVGLLPNFDIYLEDADLSMRIWNAGYTIRYVPASVVLHKYSATMGTAGNRRRKYYLNARNRLRLVLRNFPLSKAHRIVPSLVFCELKALGSPLKRGELWKTFAELQAIVASVGYVFAAAVLRARRMARGQGRCLFWHLIREDVGFFPGAGEVK
jgi:GT2 family glycosyltransferase